MFFRLFKYNVIRNIRSKEILFWNLLFPLVLGTLFNVAFGDITEKSEMFHQIPVAYVEENATDKTFSTVLSQIEKGDDELIQTKNMSLDKAKEMLNNGDLIGIYYNSGESIKLYVKKDGIKPSVLKVILDEYLQDQSTITTIAKSHPEKLQQIMTNMNKQVSMLQEEKYTDSTMNVMMTYFYALIAMSCLYGCFFGVNCAAEIKADATPLAARRLVASTNRFTVMVADIASSLLMQIFCTLVATFYLKYALHIQFGSKMPAVLLVVLIGSFIGIATGFFIGSFGKKSKDTKTGIAVAVTMLECFLSGLMVGNMYFIIETYCPILNRINPAAVIVDALYSLDIYPTMDRYYHNLVFLLVIAVVLCIASFMSVRRERYASL